jgi:hypothetical protein
MQGRDVEWEGAGLLAAGAPVVLIFFMPSIASLAVAVVELAFGTWTKSLWALFGGGCVVVLIYALVALWAIRKRIFPPPEESSSAGPTP